MGKYLVVAPNRKTVTVSVGNAEMKFEHGTFMHIDRVAKAYPKIFMAADGSDGPQPQPEPVVVNEDKKLETEVLNETAPVKKLEEGAQVLTEVMPKTEVADGQVELKEDAPKKKSKKASKNT